MAGASRWLDARTGAASARTGRSASSVRCRAPRERDSFMGNLLRFGARVPDANVGGAADPVSSLERRSVSPDTGGAERVGFTDGRGAIPFSPLRPTAPCRILPSDSHEREARGSRPRPDGPDRRPGRGRPGRALRPIREPLDGPVPAHSRGRRRSRGGPAGGVPLRLAGGSVVRPVARERPDVARDRHAEPLDRPPPRPPPGVASRDPESRGDRRAPGRPRRRRGGLGRTPVAVDLPLGRRASFPRISGASASSRTSKD